jgi:hypothetical protein
MSAHHREKISKSRVLGRLIDHAEGNLDTSKVHGPKAPMSASQVQAGIAMLKKYLPDMTYSEVKSDVTTNQKPPKIIIKGVRPENISDED